jgi:glutamine synthetase
VTRPTLSADDAAVLAALPDCEAIDLLLPDMNGLLRGKRIARSAFDKVWRDGVCLPMSLIATDITGNTVEETGLGYDIGDEDRICRPVPGSLRPVPWRAPPTLQALLGMEDADGAPFAANPREVLGRTVAALRGHGLTPVVAIELEFYLLDAAAAYGPPQTSVNPQTGTRNRSTQVYSIQDLDDYRRFTDAVAAACRAQRLPADTAVAEYAPGQFEINLGHRADALAACDDAICLKRVIKAIAADQGMLASFMAKPFVDQAGSGLHVHVSLLDDDGRNPLACRPDAPAPLLRQAIGGLQAASDDCMLLFAPHANSYRRFVANAFVPLDASWGFNNRTVALRVPYSDARNTRIEHRIAGADANPYLVTAAVLAGIADGIERQLPASEPVTGNAYRQAAARDLYWPDTIARFEHSGFIASRLGEAFRHIYGAQKRKEMRSFQREVSDIEYDWYLRNV